MLSEGVRRRGAGLLLAAAVVGVYLAHVVYLACVAEDAFITFRYARNLAEGHGLVWNPGAAPVEGYTNFLWVCLSAAAQVLGLDVPSAMQRLGVLAGIVTLGYVAWAGRRLLGWSPALATLPCMALALSGPFATWSGSGMETALFGLLLTASLVHFAAAWKLERGSQLWLAFGGALLLMLTRPEGVLVFGLLLVIGLALARAPGSLGARSVLAPAALFGLCFTGYFAWRWSYFGYPLPNTFYAKVGSSSHQVARGGRYLGYFALHFLAPWAPVVLLGALALRGRRVPDARDWLERARSQALLVASSAVLTAYAAYVVVVGGDYMAMYRFFAPVLPLLYLLLGGLVEPLLRSPLRPGRVAVVAAALLVAAAGTIVHSLPIEERLFAQPPGLHGNWRGVQKERWSAARLASIGRFFETYGRGPEESIATGAIGAIGYYTTLTVYGMHGLVDPVIAHQRDRPGMGRGVAGHERIDLPHTLSLRPTFFLVSRDLHARRPSGRAALPPRAKEILAREYRPVAHWLEDEANREAGWLGFFERRDRRAP